MKRNQTARGPFTVLLARHRARDLYARAQRERQRPAAEPKDTDADNPNSDDKENNT